MTVRVDWDGPSVPPAPFRIDLPPLAAAQMLMMWEELNGPQRAEVHPAAFRDLVSFFEQVRHHLDAVEKAERARSAASAAIFSGAVDGPIKERPTGPRPFATGRARVPGPSEYGFGGYMPREGTGQLLRGTGAVND